MYVATLTLVWWWQIILIRSGGGVNFFVQFLLQYTQTKNIPKRLSINGIKGFSELPVTVTRILCFSEF